MTVIRRFDRIDNIGPFSDWRWPDDTPEFKKFNLIYGHNGSGKTSLARLLRMLAGQSESSSSFRVACDGGTAAQDDLSILGGVDIRIYDIGYKQQIVFREEGTTTPIFSIGAEQHDLRKDLANAERQYEMADEDLAQARAWKATAKQNHEQRMTAVAGEIKRACSTMEYQHRFNRASLVNRFERWDPKTCRELDEAQLNSHRTTLAGEFHEMEPVSVPGVSDPVHAAIVALRLSAPGKIPRLAGEPTLEAWINSGLSFRSGDHLCPFCSQSEPADLQVELDAHFGDDYQRVVDAISRALREIDQARAEISQFIERIPDADHFISGASDGAAGTVKAVRSVASALEDELSAIKDLLEQKESSPSTVFDSPNSVIDLATPAAELNGAISRHNNLCSDAKRRRSEAVEAIERHYVAANHTELQSLRWAAEEAETVAASAEEKRNSMSAEADRIRSELAGTQRSADSLNAGLRQYFGDQRLSVRAKETGFEIVRSVTDAPEIVLDSLSEGERTALALVHFFTGLAGSLDVSTPLDRARRVYVIDDPVSSLDENGLFKAEALVRMCSANADQLFVLTHNFTFFRRVRRWILNKKEENRSLYYLSTRLSNGQRVPHLRELPKLLRKYESDYHYLFSVVARASGRIEPILEDDQLPHVPNAARRVLETFLSFRAPNQTDLSNAIDELAKREDVSIDPASGRALAAFLHEGSHDQAVVGQDMSDQTDFLDRRRYEEVMELVEQADPDHFRAMIEACA